MYNKFYKNTLLNDCIGGKLNRPTRIKLYFDYGTQSLDAYYDPHKKRIDSVIAQRLYSSDQ